jgi:transposase
MWKVETRCIYDRKGLRYPTDMTDPEWELARPFVDVAQSRSGQRRVDLREVLNAVFYILGTGCQWRALPKDLPPRSTVHDYFVRWQCDGTLGRLHHALYEQARERAGKEASPTTAIVDSQSVKGAERGGARLIRWAMMRPRRACPREGGGQRAQAPRRRGHARADARLRHSARQCAGS